MDSGLNDVRVEASFVSYLISETFGCSRTTARELIIRAAPDLTYFQRKHNPHYNSASFSLPAFKKEEIYFTHKPRQLNAQYNEHSHTGGCCAVKQLSRSMDSRELWVSNSFSAVRLQQFV